MRKNNSGTSSPDMSFPSNISTIPNSNPFLSYPNSLLESRIKSRAHPDVSGTDCSLILPSPPLSPREHTSEDMDRRPENEKAQEKTEEKEILGNGKIPDDEVEEDIVVDEEQTHNKSSLVKKNNNATCETIAAP